MSKKDKFKIKEQTITTTYNVDAIMIDDYKIDGLWYQKTIGTDIPDPINIDDVHNELIDFANNKRSQPHLLVVLSDVIPNKVGIKVVKIKELGTCV